MPSDQLSTTFAALADPTRRAILARLSKGEASVTELAKPFDLSLPGVSKHLKVLQRAGVITQGRSAQWRAPRRYEIKIDKFDSRPGGEWRVVHRGDDGAEYGFRGVNHDVVAPERICATFEFEGVPGHVALQTATFEPMGNKTKLVAQIVFQSVMDRDGMVASGMQEGSNESMERLAELLEKLSKEKAGR